MVLTRRSSRLRSHTGEVSFPGGRLDPGEAPLAAALREAREEVGLEPATVEVLGQLVAAVDVRQPVADHAVRRPALPGRPVLHPNPAEVERAFAVTLAELADPEVYREELWDLPVTARNGRCTSSSWSATPSGGPRRACCGSCWTWWSTGAQPDGARADADTEPGGASRYRRCRQ